MSGCDVSCLPETLRWTVEEKAQLERCPSFLAYQVFVNLANCTATHAFIFMHRVEAHLLLHYVALLTSNADATID